MLYKKKNEASLSAELFQNPGAEYRGAPFWAWNTRLEKEELERQIDILWNLLICVIMLLW